MNLSRILLMLLLLPMMASAGASKRLSPRVFSVEGVNFVMINVDGGGFYAGAQNMNPAGQNYDADADSTEAPVHRVTLSGFYMGETEVTQALWEAVTGKDRKTEGWHKDYGRGAEYPAYYISYNEIMNDFMPKLNQMALDSGLISDNEAFDLPSEAEWEYAARGGDSVSGYSGGDVLDHYGWYWDNSGGKSHEAGLKLPNGYGLKDMSGSLWEWTGDIFFEYAAGESHNPAVRGNVGGKRVLKGGSWMRGARDCRVTARSSCAQDFEYFDYGFRLVLRKK